LGLDFDTETQGKSQQSQQKGIDGVFIWILLRDQMSIRGRYILEGFNDPNSIAGGDKIHYLFSLEFPWRF